MYFLLGYEKAYKKTYTFACYYFPIFLWKLIPLMSFKFTIPVQCILEFNLLQRPTSKPVRLQPVCNAHNFISCSDGHILTLPGNVLLVNGATQKDAGEYTCIVSNSIGSSQASAFGKYDWSGLYKF